MSTLIALRYLSSSTKYSPAVTKFRKHFKYNPILSTQGLATKTNIITPNPSTIHYDEWRIVYRLPLIRLASAFNRVKVPYGMLNLIVVPASFALEQSSLLAQSSSLFISAMGVTSWFTLAICSFLIRNLIGIIYINDNNDTLKLAYVDYWGKRNDVCVKLDDVIPDSEKLKPSKVDFYLSVCLYSDDKAKYKLLQRFGNIEDPEAFASIFGE